MPEMRRDQARPRATIEPTMDSETPPNQLGYHKRKGRGVAWKSYANIKRIKEAIGYWEMEGVGAMIFKRTTNPGDAEKWLSLVERCFKVIDCPKDWEVRLAMFLFPSNNEDRSILYAVREGGINFVKDSRKDFGRSFIPVRL